MSDHNLNGVISGGMDPECVSFHESIEKEERERVYFETNDIGWVSDVESLSEYISLETRALLKAVKFLPCFEKNRDGWKVFPLIGYGKVFQWSIQQFPATSLALMKIDGLIAAMFSILGPGEEIPVHTGPNSAVLRYHLGTYVPHPEECSITVAGITKHWEEGKSLLFTDFVEHSAKNMSDDYRVILFVDVKRRVKASLKKKQNEIIAKVCESDYMNNMKVTFDEWVVSYGKEFEKASMTYAVIENEWSNVRDLKGVGCRVLIVSDSYGSTIWPAVKRVYEEVGMSVCVKNMGWIGVRDLQERSCEIKACINEFNPTHCFILFGGVDIEFYLPLIEKSANEFVDDIIEEYNVFISEVIRPSVENVNMLSPFPSAMNDRLYEKLLLQGYSAHISQKTSFLYIEKVRKEKRALHERNMLLSRFARGLDMIEMGELVTSDMYSNESHYLIASDMFSSRLSAIIRNKIM